jgi:8-oxo-dGTP diphosphatase
VKPPRHKITPAIFLLLIQDNKILMTRRVNTGWEDGNYTFPSGHVEVHETPRQALVREAQEEIGITIQEEDLHFEHVAFRNSNGEDRVDIFFTASKHLAEPTNKEPHLCDDIAWFPIDNLPENTISFLKDIISLYKEKVPYSEMDY